jgi:hypothetical protein
VAYLEPFQVRRAALARKPGYAWEVLAEGAANARPVIREVVDTVRLLVNIDETKTVPVEPTMHEQLEKLKGSSQASSVRSALFDPKRRP